jgi:hypothetical protein
MRKVFTTSMLVAIWISRAVAGSGPAKASKNEQSGQVGAVVPVSYLPMVHKFSYSIGAVYGWVIDAGDGFGIPFAQVCYGVQCTNAHADGSYFLDGLPPGEVALDASATEYMPLSGNVTVVPAQSVFLQFVLSKDPLSLTNVFIRNIVTWSSQPYITTPLGTWENDMDAHMWLDVGGLVTHLYSGSGDGTNNCSAFPNMCLKVDRRLGSGPETIDVSQLEVEGHYYFGVFNVNQVYDLVNYPTLRDLDVVVRLADDSGGEVVLNAPQGQDVFWYVFQMDQYGVVTIMNCLTGYPGDDLPTCPPPP